MGKIISDRPKGSFVAREGQNGQVNIHLRYFINGKYVKKSTGIKVNASDWDQSAQKIKGNTNPRINNLHKQWNLMLQEEKSKYDKQIQDYEGQLTHIVVKQMLEGTLHTKDKQIRETDFVEYCQQLYRQRFDQGKISYSYWYNKKLLIQHFNDFFVNKYKRDVISICDLSPALFEDYKTYRIKTKKNCTASVNKALVPLYEGLKSLYENGLLDHLTYNGIYGKYESYKVTKYDPNVSTKVIRYLTPEQLQDFVKMYHNTNRQKTWEYMQMFLFAVNTGLRISDIATLEWKHIDLKNRHLMKNMVKTKEVVELYLNDAAIEILEIWKKWNRNSRFVFNLLKEDIDFNDSKYVHNAITSKNRIIQTSLRTIGEKMKLPFSLTMHVARHTFAVLAIQNNTDIYKVSKMLGHTSTRCTESTYADFLPNAYKKSCLEKLDFGITISAA